MFIFSKKKRIEDRQIPKIGFLPQQKQILSKSLEWTSAFFDKAVKNGVFLKGGHGLDHSQRVAGMAGVISKLEGADAFLPVLASILHDLGRASKDKRAETSEHGELSVEIASDFIDSLEIPEEDKQTVKYAIADHPKLNMLIRKNEVVQILMDSDRLDGLGAIGPIRSAVNHWNIPIYEEFHKGSSTKDEDIKSIYQDFAFRIVEWNGMLWTESAKAIAKPRVEMLKNFSKEYLKEIKFMEESFENLSL